MSSFLATLSLDCKVGTAEVEFLPNSTGFFLHHPQSATTPFLPQNWKRGAHVFRNVTPNFRNTGDT